MQGFRASVDIDKAGGNQMGTLQARIYGVSQSDMNAVTSLLWKPNAYKLNTVVVTAIDGDQQTQVFADNITGGMGEL